MSSPRAGRCRRRLHGRWVGKVAFASPDTAEAWAAEATETYGVAIGAYACDRCGHWHVGRRRSAR